MRASELIERLQALIEKHGDQAVYSGGEDYPGQVEGVSVRERGDGYVPAGAFDIAARDW